MVNIFYLYGIIWSAILICYSLNWSDLCTQLDEGLLFFVISMIVISLSIGYIFRKKLKFQKLDTNPHKSAKITILLWLFYILEFMYERKIPLLSVMKGISYRRCIILWNSSFTCSY